VRRKKCDALIDTGSQYTTIDEAEATRLQLVLVRQENIGTVNQQRLLNIYRAELEIPSLGIQKFGEVLGGFLSGGNHDALLGREELSECQVQYDGVSGRVTITR
jgi:predicted aspartyl protease